MMGLENKFAECVCYRSPAHIQEERPLCELRQPALGVLLIGLKY